MKQSAWILWYKPGHEKATPHWPDRRRKGDHPSGAVKGIFATAELAIEHRGDDAYDVEQFSIHTEEDE